VDVVGETGVERVDQCWDGMSKGIKPRRVLVRREVKGDQFAFTRESTDRKVGEVAAQLCSAQ